jgi:hypothetical protein
VGVAVTADEMLAADPAFQTVCDARRDAWLDAVASEPADPVPWELAWCGDRDGDDAAQGA